jgi:hypothetical protein
MPKDMRESLTDEVEKERENILRGMKEGVNAAMQGLPAGAAEWDNYYILLGLGAGLVCVFGSAVAALPAVLAVAGKITTTVAGELPCLGMVAIGGATQAGGGLAAGWASYEQNLGRPDFNPTQGIINSMKEKIQHDINDEIDNNRAHCKPVVNQLMSKNQKDPAWIRACCSDGEPARDLRKLLVRVALYGAPPVSGWHPTNWASEAAKRKCEYLFQIIVDVYPEYKPTAGSPGIVSFGSYSGQRAPLDSEIQNFKRKYPTFLSFLTAQPRYSTWLRNSGTSSLGIKMTGT